MLQYSSTVGKLAENAVKKQMRSSIISFLEYLKVSQVYREFVLLHILLPYILLILYTYLNLANLTFPSFPFCLQKRAPP